MFLCKDQSEYSQSAYRCGHRFKITPLKLFNPFSTSLPLFCSEGKVIAVRQPVGRTHVILMQESCSRDDFFPSYFFSVTHWFSDTFEVYSV